MGNTSPATPPTSPVPVDVDDPAWATSSSTNTENGEPMMCAPVGPVTDRLHMPFSRTMYAHGYFPRVARTDRVANVSVDVNVMAVDE